MLHVELTPEEARALSCCDCELADEEAWQSATDKLHVAIAGSPQPCRTCGEIETPGGRICPRCEASLEEDRLNRETYGG